MWESANRAITLHGTRYLVARDNVAFDVAGHVFFLEDGIETRNILDHNLACLVHQAAPLPDQTLSFDMNTVPFIRFEENEAHRMRFELVDSAIRFPRWDPAQLLPKGVRQYGSEEPMVDDLPPSTIITNVEPLPNGRWLVRGSVAEDGMTKSVTVNSQVARSIPANFAEWQATVAAPLNGRMVAKTEDAIGNVEPCLHEIELPAEKFRQK